LYYLKKGVDSIKYGLEYTKDNIEKWLEENVYAKVLNLGDDE